ncbi:DUF6985 domain-containing protein [Labrys monachus]|uniref:DUF6985 domain-containing protein n=1 Tax=Labrys monachus TaxID=217067 RepID=A0ABU0FLD4_9HYPH|nr:hypothetical protein [Labrys monachus]MDQ0395410.1 hypothetical protein [Labrys monachus]
MITKLNDPVFGELDQTEWAWIRNYRVSMFGESKEVELEVEWEEPDILPSTEQQETFLKFDRNKNKCFSDIENAIYKYYLSILNNLRNDLGDSADELMPIVSDVNGLKDLVSLQAIIIKPHYGIWENKIVFLLDCTWDTSLGLGVAMIDNKVTEVGEQDIVL